MGIILLLSVFTSKVEFLGKGKTVSYSKPLSRFSMDLYIYFVNLFTLIMPNYFRTLSFEYLNGLIN